MTNPSISRMADPGEFVPELNDISAALFRATGNRSVSRSTMNLVHLRAGQIVGNTYLTVLNTGFLRKAGESEERITAVSSWQDAPYFTDAERARCRRSPTDVPQPSAGGAPTASPVAEAADCPRLLRLADTRTSPRSPAWNCTATDLRPDPNDRP
ncbi:carboxymuconolactone decarboxylase family protein [Streptomyces sp. NPDC005917]|uniref:carboxymuconolactone decarboxylase family protein n=1 Tax=unclassified Streptomyces TaxID=2593676 RepID=UPI0033E3A705